LRFSQRGPCHCGLPILTQSAMPITTQLANRVLKMRRQGMTIAQMPAHMTLRAAEILDVHQMLGIGIADKADEPTLTLPSDAEREAMIDRLPKKMQDRIRRSRFHARSDRKS